MCIYIKDIKILKEAFPTNHYLLRKQERGNILEIHLPSEIFSDIHREYDKAKVFSALKLAIEEKLFNVLSLYETTEKPIESNLYKAFRILHVILVYRGKQYKIELEVEYTQFLKDGSRVKKRGRGNTYAIIQAGTSLVTLLLIDEKADLYRQAVESLERNPKVNIEHVRVEETTTLNYTFQIDLNELMEGKSEKRVIKIEDLPYRVKTDYRVGERFIHDAYGEGTIINTSQGKKGDPGSGALEWVEVKFPLPKPILKSGQLITFRTERIKNVISKSYWRGKQY